MAFCHPRLGEGAQLVWEGANGSICLSRLHAAIAASAALTLSASKHVSIRIMSTPPSIRACACRRYAFCMSSNEYGLKAGSETSGESERDFDVGPMLPATNTLRLKPIDAAISAASSAASRARRAPSYAICSAKPSQPYSACDITFALNVLVSMMSAPAAMYSLWIDLMMSGRVRLRHSLLPFSSFAHCAKGPQW